MKTTALTVIVILFAGRMALGAPATPAVPGGGNPHNDNPNAATPATPHGGNPHNDNPDAATPATPATPAAPAPPASSGGDQNAGGANATAPAGGNDNRGGEHRKGEKPGMSDEGKPGTGHQKKPLPGNEGQYADKPMAAGWGGKPGMAVGLEGPMVDDMDDPDVGDLIQMHPDLQNKARAMWDAMNRKQRDVFLRTHPAMSRRVLFLKWGRLTIVERAQFMRSHEEIHAWLMQRWDGMRPDQRKAFCDRHPRATKAWRDRSQRDRRDRGVRGRERGDERDGVRRGGNDRDNVRPGDERGNQGVRDRGAGRGRNDAGRGGERRSPGNEPRR